MLNYTVIVDDDDESRITYSNGSWSTNLKSSQHAYKWSKHTATSPSATLTFSFHGGREVFVRGDFGDHDATHSSPQYPKFQVDSEDLDCKSGSKGKAGHFHCSYKKLSDDINSHTLKLLPSSKSSSFQPFNIDYIRYGSSSTHVARRGKTKSMFVKSPGAAQNLTDLSLNGNWTQDFGGSKTFDATANATYTFQGDHIAWWGCCMPEGTTGNDTTGTYTIDGSPPMIFNITASEFVQGPKCNTAERILFQSELPSGNHTLEVTYGGDDTKLPLTLCALAAVPSGLDALEADPSKSKDGSGKTGPNKTDIVAGILAGLAFACICLLLTVCIHRRRRARYLKSRTSFNAPRLAIRRVVPSIDLAAHEPPTRRTSIAKESILEAPPPFYRSSIAKGRFSWRSFTFRHQPPQQTAYVGSEYGKSAASFDPRASVNSTSYLSYGGYANSEPPSYTRGGKGYYSSPVLPIPS